MSFVPAAEVEEFRGQLRKFLQQNAGSARLRGFLETQTGYDTALWRRAVDEMALTGLTAPESAGGGDADLLTAGVVFEELGRALACAPFFSTIALATQALRCCAGTDGAAAHLAAIASGTVATLAWGGLEPATTRIAATGAGDRVTLTGTAEHVIDGNDAELLLVAARSGSGVGLFVVDTGAPGLDRTPLTGLDTTRRLSRLDLAEVPAALIADDCAAGLGQAFDVAALLLAAEQLGGARRAMEMAVDHAKTRLQFGRPIGSFQAIKHRCADMLVDVELATSLVYNALHAVDVDPSAAPLEASIVRGFVPDVYLAVAAANIQVHGGIGFTWEHDAHLYLKRAKSSQLILGSPTRHRRRAAELLGVLA